MLPPERYEGREQTYVKHFVLEQYLERVAYNIFSFKNQFVYVDGFSGPWQSADENLDDTSFKIAVDKLRTVKQGILDQKGKTVSFKCFFVEKNEESFQRLQAAVADITDVKIEIVNDTFENSIQRVVNFVGRDFALIFIDPTGWSGYALNKIKPLLNLRGEVLINLMIDHMNRFFEDARPEIAKSFDETFGPNWYEEWKALVDAGLSREAAAVQIYRQRLKASSNFEFTTSTRILKPNHDRAYFHLVYGTEHPKGVQELRSVEKKAVPLQERIRNISKSKKTADRTGQESLFGGAMSDAPTTAFEDERNRQLSLGRVLLSRILDQHPAGILFEKLLPRVLETPLVWESDVKKWIVEGRKSGKLVVVGWGNRQRVPLKGNLVRSSAGACASL